MLTVTVEPLQTVVVAGVTTGVVNGNASMLTVTAFDAAEAHPDTVEITV
jgi:hypothetical protein